MFSRFIARLAVLVLAATGLVALAATPASAALPGFHFVDAQSELRGSEDFKEVVVRCDDGEVLIGISYLIEGWTRSVVVDDMTPNGSATTQPTSAVLTAYESDPTSSPWSLIGTATCVEPLSRDVYVLSNPSEHNGPGDFHSATAQCAIADVVLGAGYTMVGARGGAAVDELLPSIGAGPGIFVAAYQTDAFSGDWSLTAYAICGPPVSGLTTERGASENNTEDKSAEITCTGDRVPISAWWNFTGSTGDASVDDIFTSASTSQMVIAASGLDPISTNWRFDMYVRCASR
ncbi:hypothetical protein Aph01nite_45430 [Acrocarpospora phusangensis]|uniref:Ig-like domain-containing protein n=1 Tax=Acrocarpospora phusangensis TaxID=1070424 RepID=A0A919QEW8_9ACTN|nr:hypothetical protein [Acrocarpospora phusangensis]GIH26233.1 hypothetical protein Aph01nite_45430 [Acrocarpospora phusangensis]